MKWQTGFSRLPFFMEPRAMERAKKRPLIAERPRKHHSCNQSGPKPSLSFRMLEAF